MKEITPAEFMCHTASCCPAVFKKDDDTYVIIGKKSKGEDLKQLAGRYSEDEFVVEVPRGMIDQLVRETE